MLKKSLFTSLLHLCKEHDVEHASYKKGDVIIDHISDHNIYLFASGWYTVSTVSALGGIHEVGDIDGPSVIGEGVFFGNFLKPIKIICESEKGEIYKLSERMIALISKKNVFFHEMLMRACLAITSERITEANMERTIGYALVDALEKENFGSIPALLTTLKDTFGLVDIIWIERHEVLQDIFSLRYRQSQGNIPVNVRINIDEQYLRSEDPHSIELPDSDEIMHFHPFLSRGECFGGIGYIIEKKRLPGYISRITFDMAPNCIRIIETGWKNQNEKV